VIASSRLGPMSLRRALPILLTTAFCWTSIAAGEPVDLRYKWPADQELVFLTTEVMRTERTRVADGSVYAESAGELQMVHRVRIGPPNTDGTTTLHETWEHTQARHHLITEQIVTRYDSADPETADNPNFADLQSLVGRTLETIVETDGSVVSQPNLDAVRTAALERHGDKPRKTQLEAHLDTVNALADAERRYAHLPTKGVVPGQTWTRLRQRRLGRVRQTSEYVYTFKGVTDVNGERLAVIDFNSSSEDGEIASTITGRVLFSIDRGHVLDVRWVFDGTSPAVARDGTALRVRNVRTVHVGLVEEPDPPPAPADVIDG
jgi:hypothetical protein